MVIYKEDILPAALMDERNRHNYKLYVYDCVSLLSQAILQDLFPGVTIPEHDYGALQDEIVSVMKTKGLQPELCLIKKVIQFFETMVVRHGVMLVGPTGGGKTTCYEVSGLS